MQTKNKQMDKQTEGQTDIRASDIQTGRQAAKNRHHISKTVQQNVTIEEVKEPRDQLYRSHFFLATKIFL